MESDHPGGIVHLEWQFVQMLSSSGAVARASYYDVSYGPTVMFDGTDEIRGWTAGTASSYEATFADHSSALSQITVEAEASFDEATRTGTVTVTVSVAA